MRKPMLFKRRVAPTLDLDFSKGVMPLGISFSRGSAATYVGPDGKLQWAPMNLVPNSEMIGFAAGTPGSTPGAAFSTTTNGITRTLISTVGGKTQVRYFGTATAAGQIGIDPTAAVSVAAGPGQPFVAGALVSVVAGSTNGKPIYARLIERNSGGSVLVSTDVAMTSGVFTSVSRTASNATIAFMQFAIRIDYLLNDVLDVTFELSQAQFNIGTTLQPYSATYGTAYHGPRIEYDPVTLAPVGLLVEESRTNLNPISNTHLQNTGATLLKNAVDSFGNANSAYTVSEDTSSGGHFVVGQTISYVSGTTYTFTAEVWPDTANRVQLASPATPFAGLSAFANFSLVGAGSVLLAGAGVTGTPTIRRGANGSYIISISALCNTSTTGASAVVVFITSDSQARIPGYTGDGTLKIRLGHVQCEAGPTPSSIIPTYGVAAARSGDLASVAAGTWLKAYVGTLSAEAVYYTQSGVPQAAAHLDNGTSSERVYVRKNGAAAMDMGLMAGGVFQTTTQGGLAGAVTLGVPSKSAISYGGGTVRIAKDAGTGLEATGQIMPAVNTLGIGNASFGSVAINGHVRRVRYWPNLMSSSALAAITR